MPESNLAENRLARYVPVANAVAKLLHPYAEVVLHDVQREVIFFIANAFSKRKEGDPSLIESLDELQGSSVIGPYDKANWNGDRIRSITSVLRGADQQILGLFCINLDVSQFERALALIEGFVRPAQAESISDVFMASDWREQINLIVAEFLKLRSKSFDALELDERIELVRAIDDRRLFEARRSATYVASQFNVSRATIYNYLNRARGAVA